MASFYMKVYDYTTPADVSKTLEAFKTLYGDTIVSVRGMMIQVAKKDWLYSSQHGRNAIQLKAVGKKYITVSCEGNLYRVNLNDAHHGIEELLFMTED